MTLNSSIKNSCNLKVDSGNLQYESISTLYQEKKPDASSELVAFVVSCSDRLSNTGVLQKLEVNVTTSFLEATIDVTHQVHPGLSRCAQIIPVNSKLQVAGFDSAAITPIKNFGPKKTFNCDVRASTHLFGNSVSCLAADVKGQQLATGSVDAKINLFTVREEEITLMSRGTVEGIYVTGLSFMQPVEDICSRPKDQEVLDDENLLIYSAEHGYVGLIDARVKMATSLTVCPVVDVRNEQIFRSICVMKSIPGQIIYLGTEAGMLFGYDLRRPAKKIFSQNLPDDRFIGKIKEVVVPENSNKNKTFIAYNNWTNKIKILDSATMQPDVGWIGDRLPEECQYSLCQVANRIVTCGASCTLGCWEWKNSSSSISLPS